MSGPTDGELPFGATAEPPPPSPELLGHIGTMGPVRTRVPWRSLGGAMAATALWGALGLLVFRVRPDLGEQLGPRFCAVALLWLLAWGATMYALLVPPKGQVLPDLGRALLVGAVATAAIVVGVLAGTTPVSSSVLVPPGGFWRLASHCMGFTLGVFAGAFPLILVALRRLVPVGAVRAGLAGGVAGGALGGLLLHFLCPVATPSHVGVAHAGSVLLCALLGGAITAAFRR